MDLLAVIAVAVVIGTWLGVRWAEAGRQIDTVISTVLSTPLPKPCACAAPESAAHTGDRTGESPRPGAVSTLDLPVPAQSPASAARAPGHK